MAVIRKLIAPALLSLLCAAQAHSEALDPTLLKLMGVQGPHSQFAGPYVGAKFGVDRSDVTGPNPKSSQTTYFPGLVAGVNYDIGRFVIGFEGFMDFHDGSTTGKDGGIDLKFGMPVNGNFLPYGRIGFTGTWPDTRLHYGAGVEYKLEKNWSVAAEYTGDKSSYQGGHRRNDSLTVGVHYYFF